VCVWLVQLLSSTLLVNNSGQVVDTHVPLFTKQYNLIPAKGRWCPKTGKVTVDLASHWPCIMDSSGLFTYGLKGHRKGDELSASALGVWFFYPYFCCVSSALCDGAAAVLTGTPSDEGQGLVPVTSGTVSPKSTAVSCSRLRSSSSVTSPLSPQSSDEQGTASALLDVSQQTGPLFYFFKKSNNLSKQIC